MNDIITTGKEAIVFISNEGWQRGSRGIVSKYEEYDKIREI